MACFPHEKRKLLWSPVIFILITATVTNIFIISLLFTSKTKTWPTSFLQRGDYSSAAKISEHLVRNQTPLMSTLRLAKHTETPSFNQITKKVTTKHKIGMPQFSTKNAAGVLSNQTLPSNLRSGLLKPGTKEEAMVRKLMSIRRLRIVNPHDYGYRISPTDACTNKVIEAVLCVVSAVDNFKLRHLFRNVVNGGYAGIWNKVNRVVLLFFLGTPSSNNDTSLQTKIDNESHVYGDIVQATFIDTYRNLSIKTVSILKWVSECCSSTKFVIKMDDDCDINIPLMITELHNKQQELPLFMLGRLATKSTPVRIKASKWYIPKSLYKEDKYPPFIYGGSQGYPTEVAKLLFEASLRIPMFRLEDVFISGLCANMVNIPRFDSIAFYFSHIPPPGETEY